MKDNDILLYVDSGCKLFASGEERLNDYIKIVNNSKHGNLSFELTHYEYEYTKMDLFNALDAHNLKDTKQLLSGIFLMKKTDSNIALVEKWLSYWSDYKLVNDDPSVAPNYEGFQAHRHDQSIFSILRKQYGTEILPDETFEVDGSKPIHALRIIS